MPFFESRRVRHVRRGQQVKKSKKGKKTSNISVITNPSRIQAFEMYCTGITTPSYIGKIRMLIKKDVPDYLKIPLYSHDRSITEWYDLFDCYKKWDKCIQRDILLDEAYNPFFHIRAAGVLLEKEYEHQMKIRWIVQKWIQRVRSRIYQRRVIGETDVCTFEPVAAKDAIRIFCHTTKSVYQFHMHTIIRMIRENLYFEQWGRADPMDPRNPYTNKPWSLAQLIELIHQLHINTAKRHTTLPSFILRFVEAGYVADTFYRRNKLELGIDATKRFFKTPESILVRNEILHGLFEQIDRLHKLCVYRYVSEKRCISILQTKWEDLIENKWMHDNYGYSPLYMWRDSFQQMNSTKQLFIRTNTWFNSRFPQINLRMLLNVAEAGAPLFISLEDSLSVEESDGNDSN